MCKSTLTVRYQLPQITKPSIFLDPYQVVRTQSKFLINTGNMRFSHRCVVHGMLRLHLYQPQLALNFFAINITTHS